MANGDNLFYPEALEEIKEFEQSIGDYPGHEDFCLRPPDLSEPSYAANSVANIFFSLQQRVDSSTVAAKFDGSGSLMDIKGTLLEFPKQGVLWWTDVGFNAKNLASRCARTSSRWRTSRGRRVGKEEEGGPGAGSAVPHWSLH